MGKPFKKIIVRYHPDLADRLRAWTAEKPADAPLWPGKWARDCKGGQMFKADLARAKGAWIAEATGDRDRTAREGSDFLAYRDGSGRYADLHACRHTYISTVVRSGATPRVAQSLARHSTITLTMDRYSHTALHDLNSAVQALPVLPEQRQSPRWRRCGRPARTGNLVAHRLHRFRATKGTPGHLLAF